VSGVGEEKESRMRDWITALSLLTTALIAAPAMAQERPWEWGMHPGWWMWGAGAMVMMLMMLVFWGLVIAGLVLGIRWLARQGREDRPDRALDILRERYARGEINKEEFEARKRDLASRAA
jgi:putative membrane protein